MDELNQVLGNPFRVLCVDASNLDDRIEESERIQEGVEYVVTNIFTNLIGDGGEAYKLLGNNPFPFKGFSSHRFKITNFHSVN